MKEWMFKIVWVPCWIILSMCSIAVLAAVFKEVGWEQPFRWLCIIGLIAYVADYYVNR